MGRSQIFFLCVFFIKNKNKKQEKGGGAMWFFSMFFPFLKNTMLAEGGVRGVLTCLGGALTTVLC